DRTAAARDKTGVPTGGFVVHPITGQRVPIWVADYVLGGYGTGAVMAVPGHDERDFAFARAFGLPVVEVVSPDGQVHAHLGGAIRAAAPGMSSVTISRSPSTSESSRFVFPNYRISVPATIRQGHSRASPTGASSRKTGGGSRARRTRCPSGRARAGTTCASSIRRTTP